MKDKDVSAQLNTPLDQPDVLCIGAPIIDAIAQVPHSFLRKNKIHKGGSTIVSDDKLGKILSRLGDEAQYLAGGCAANTACSLATLDTKVQFAGRIGEDQQGKAFCDAFEDFGVHYDPAMDDDRGTAVLACLVTPDRERSFVYSMTSARWFLSLDDLPRVMPRVVYCESNIIDVSGENEGQTFLDDLLAARFYRGSVIIMNLNDSNLMGERRERVLRGASQVDIVMGNRDEFKALFEVGEIVDLAEDPRLVDKICVITDGPEPVHLVHNSICEKVIVPRVGAEEIVSTLGAGDAFAAGFIAAFLKSEPLYMCALFGAKQSTKIIKKLDGRP